MLNKKLKPLRKGQKITAEFLNQLIDQINNLGSLTVAGGSGSGISWVGGKPVIKPGVAAEQIGFWAKIEGTPDWVNGRYGWQELNGWHEPTSEESVGWVMIDNGFREGEADDDETCAIEITGFRFCEEDSVVFMYPPTGSIPHYWFQIPWGAQVVQGKNIGGTGAVVYTSVGGGEGNTTGQTIQLTSNSDYFLQSNKHFTARRLPKLWAGNKNSDIYSIINVEC